jgi:hypothetical protein
MRFLSFHLVGHRLFVYFAGGWVVFVARIVTLFPDRDDAACRQTVAPGALEP